MKVNSFNVRIENDVLMPPVAGISAINLTVLIGNGFCGRCKLSFLLNNAKDVFVDVKQ